VAQLKSSQVYLSLRLGYWVREVGHEVRTVKIRSCIDLLIGLDLSGVNPTKVPITFRASQLIVVDTIKFDSSFSGNQKLVLAFDNVQSVAFRGLHVDEALEIRVQNVKSLVLESSTFSHLPPGSVQVDRTGKVTIRDCIFLRISPGSFQVKRTKEVEVTKNELSVNAIKAISATEGSHLYISCNRLLGDPIPPECLPTTTTTTTTTSTTTTSTTTTSRTSSSALAVGSTTTSSSSTGLQTLLGVVVGTLAVLLLLLAVLLLLLLRRQHTKSESAAVLVPEEPEAPPVMSTIPAPPPMPPAPSPIAEHKITGQEVPKLPPPIWLEEIQCNAIFNKQRHKLLSDKQSHVEKEEGRDDLEEHSLKENSKTESDQEAEEAEDLC